MDNNTVIFKITEKDIEGTLGFLGIDKLSTGRMLDLFQFVGDRFENRAPEDIADAVMDFFDCGGG